jgi:hypothetical protein
MTFLPKSKDNKLTPVKPRLTLIPLALLIMIVLAVPSTALAQRV